MGSDRYLSRAAARRREASGWAKPLTAPTAVMLVGCWPPVARQHAPRRRGPAFEHPSRLAAESRLTDGADRVCSSGAEGATPRLPAPIAGAGTLGVCRSIPVHCGLYLCVILVQDGYGGC